ncbi:MAG: hypothetical protein K2N38_03460 [Oscillospiraceae bacterium]|nr:hypothetical protein [Oscillospiraceae bacterium]
MAINTIEAAKGFVNALDRQMVEDATSGWMEANAGQVKYSGGNEVKIPIISTSGLADYDRDNGYNQGAVSLSFQTKKLTKDRGRQFLLDAMDVDDSNFIANASAVMSEFQRTRIIPEVDAYRYSQIYALAKEKYGKTYTPAASTILSALTADISAVNDTAGAADLVIIMPYPVADILDSTEKISRYVNVGSFKQGKVDLKVKTFNGIPVIRVPSARMKSAYTFNDGKTDGQTDGGFTPAKDAVQINWIVCPKNVPIAVSKTDNIKIFDPAVNQKADAWLIQYRKYHDLWIKDNALETVRVCAAPAAGDQT